MKNNKRIRHNLRWMNRLCGTVFIVLAIFLLLPAAAEADTGHEEIIIGTVAKDGAAGAMTFDITNVIISGTNRALVVAVGFNNNNGETPGSVILNPGPSQVTLTHLDNVYAIVGGDDGYVLMYGVVNPPTGTFTVRVTISDPTLSDEGMLAGAWPLTGVDQANPFDTAVGTAQDMSSGGTATFTVGSDPGDLVLAAIFNEAGTETVGQESGVWLLDSVSGTQDNFGGQHEKAEAGSTTSLHWAINSSSDKWAAIGVAVNPAKTTIGDGTSPANKDVAPDDTNKAVNAFTLYTNSAGTIDTVTALEVTFSGTAVADVAASGVKIYDDSTGGTPNEWDATDTLKGTASFSGSTASVTVSISVDSTPTQYLVTYDIATGATGSDTLQGAVTGATVTNKLVYNDTTDATLTISAAATTTIGDGASPASKGVAQYSINNAVDAFTLSTDTGTDTVTALEVTFSGTAVADVASSGVKIYDDSTGGTANEWDAADTLKGTASFSGSTASVTVSISVDDSAIQYLVTYNIAPGATLTNTLQGYITNATADNTLVYNDTTDATLTICECDTTPTVYDTATSTTYDVPGGCDQITIKAWGAGGGGGGGGSSQGGYDDTTGAAAGGGGFAKGTIWVTGSETLTVRVGGGGGGGLGLGDDPQGYEGEGGGGGGYTGVLRSGTALVIAGGGGGGSGADNDDAVVPPGVGGAGGGLIGTDGDDYSTVTGGGGGNTTGAQGGAKGLGTAAQNDGTAGSSLLGGGGGDANNSPSAGGAEGTNGGGIGGGASYSELRPGGGGGGGGYFGGGGGGGVGAASFTGAGGGGGSSYTTGSSTQNTSGSGTSVGNQSEANTYAAGAGTGGSGGVGKGAAGTDGSDGLLVIIPGNCVFSYRKPITIQSSEVFGSSNHLNFPMLVSLSGDWLKTTIADSTNGRIQNASGYDIIFRDTNLEQLDHEIEEYDGSASGGTLVAWVRIPILDFDEDTVIYMYYGNSCISSSLENVTGVWNTNYKGVWHLKETPVDQGTHADSTSNGNTGTWNDTNGLGNTDATGRIDGADDFDGGDDCVDVGNLQDLSGSSELTMSVWFYANTLPSSSSDNDGVFIQHDGFDEQMGMRFDGDASTLNGYVETGDVNAEVTIDYSGNIVINTWYHVVLTFKNGVSELFLDSVSKGTDDQSTSFTTLPDLINNMFIASLDQRSSDYFDGTIDEVRVSNSVRSDDWIETEHYNQKENSTFFIEGDEDDLGDCAYAFFKPITIESDEVFGTSDHTDFPFLVNIATDDDLRTTGNNGDIENTDGYDIIFRDSYGRQLDHEIEDYVPTSGKFVAWVRIPTLSLNDDTVIYMYYGNSCISASQENVTGVWDSNYKGVWHLKESGNGTADEYTDSTSNPNHGQGGAGAVDEYPTLTTSGKISGAQIFDGVDDFIKIGTGFPASLKMGTGNFSVSFWSKQDFTTQGDDKTIWGAGTSDKRYAIKYYGSSGRIKFLVDDASTKTELNSISCPDDDGWHHVVAVRDRTSDVLRLYLDGTQTDTEPDMTENSIDEDTGVNIGKMLYSSDFYQGLVDEMRVSNFPRSAGWIKTCYYNQKAGSTFYSIDPEEEYSPTAVDLISFTATGQDESVLVEWETAQEIDNLGFNLYRTSDPGGTYTKLNSSLIPGLISSVSGQQYTYIDRDVTRDVLYYYMLEDVDLKGIRTMHGPVCVDWDGDGIPDDYDEQEDDDSDDDTDDNPEVKIPELRFEEVDFGPEGWTPSSSYASWVKLSSFRARQGDEGIALEWETSFEIDNFGFHVYREVGGKFYRITPDLVPGSVFKAGAGRELPAGQSYMYWDGLSEGTGHELYWLDCVDLNGGRASFGPIKPEIYGQPVSERLKVRFKSITRHQGSRARALGKARELRVELNTKPIQTQSSKATFRTIDPENPSEPRLPPSEEQWALAAQSGVKIYIREDGWYRVGKPELVAAGLSPDVDPRYLQLYADGEEKSMMVTGSDDGRFDPLDAVEFYGTGLDTSFTAAHVYWLVVGSRPGRRVDTPFIDIRLDLGQRMRIPRGLRGRGAPLSFPFPMELKERTFYFAALKNGERENFFGSLISTEPVDQLLTVAHPDLSSPEDAVLEVVLQGATDSTHQVKIMLNYVEVGELGFGGQQLGAVEIQVPSDLLLEGDNIVTLTALGGATDVSLVDHIRLTYWRTYTADEDFLQFETNGGEWLSIGGFSSSEIQVVDITDPMRMINIRGKVMTQDSDYAITVKVPGAGERTLLAFTEESIKAPAGIEANLASSWHEISQGAEVIIIGHSALLESVGFLKQLREQQGWSVVLVDVEDLYDEFNFGSKNPWALKDFLAQAYQYWNPQPRFVLLVGDASYDPRNYLGYGEYDLVPTKFVDTEHLTTASDDWFVDFDVDGLPEMAMGRLPVESAEEAETVVSKIIAFEGVAGLMNEALLVADISDSIDFEGVSGEVADELLEGSMEVREILRGRSATARSDLLTLLNQGQLLVNYIGHGSTKIWNGNLLTSSDAWTLTNSPYLPFLVSMTCLNGFFQDPYSESLAETFLKAERGGAVAVWTSSGLTLPGKQAVMNLELIQLLFNGQGLTIGEAVMRAKQATTNRDIRRTWILFGDPTLRLR